VGGNHGGQRPVPEEWRAGAEITGARSGPVLQASPSCLGKGSGDYIRSWFRAKGAQGKMFPQGSQSWGKAPWPFTHSLAHLPSPPVSSQVFAPPCWEFPCPASRFLSCPVPSPPCHAMSPGVLQPVLGLEPQVAQCFSGSRCTAEYCLAPELGETETPACLLTPKISECDSRGCSGMSLRGSKGFDAHPPQYFMKKWLLSTFPPGRKG